MSFSVARIVSSTFGGFFKRGGEDGDDSDDEERSSERGDRRSVRVLLLASGL